MKNKSIETALLKWWAKTAPNESGKTRDQTAANLDAVIRKLHSTADADEDGDKPDDMASTREPPPAPPQTKPATVQHTPRRLNEEDNRMSRKQKP